MRFWTRAGVVGIAVSALLAAPTASGWAHTPSPQPGRRVAAAAVPALRAQLRAGTLTKSHGIVKVCAQAHLACQAEAITASKTSKSLLISGTPIGYGATDLEAAYGLNGAKAGSGGTIAVIESGAYPTLESDLTIYRDTYGLPRCTSASGCFKQVNYLGGAPYQPSTDPYTSYVEEEAAFETALDVDMASAACPHCKILELQVPALDGAPETQADVDTATLHFAQASQTAVRMGVKAISISYGYPSDTYTDTGSPAADFQHHGVAVVASSGDGGVNVEGNLWPSDLTTVIAAGGTSLFQDKTNSRGFTDTAWGDPFDGIGAGSGCTYDLGPAVGQPDAISDLCYGSRAASDISSDADPNTGVAVYDSYAPATGFPYGFTVAGGTSASSPFIAGMYARAGVPKATVGPSEIYGAPASRFRDVVIGQTELTGTCEDDYGLDDSFCTAGPGWDGPTGLGVPKGLSSFAPAS